MCFQREKTCYENGSRKRNEVKRPEDSALRPGVMSDPVTALSVFLLPQRKVPCCHWRLILCCAVLMGCYGCTGYRVGTSTLYNTEIKTVHVPIFESDSFRRDMGERLTEAVCKKIEQRTPYKVVHRSRSADSILTGRLARESQSVSLVDDYAGTRQKKVELLVYVQWKDRRGNSLRTMSPITWIDAPVDITTTSNMVAELGHSYATASQDAINQMADQIVDMMQMPW